MAVLSNKVALVTGASRGIGRATALALAHEGCDLVLVARHQEALEQVARVVRDIGRSALPMVCDVGSRMAVQTMIETVKDRGDVVQILVNNAGIAPAARFLDMADELFEDVMRVNLMGTYHCSKGLLRGMIDTGWGRVVNIASISGKVAFPHTSAYTASKHAVLGLTRVLALETARSGVTVNAICPGYADTPLTRENARIMAKRTAHTPAEVLGLFAGTSPQQRLILPEEIASLVVFLAGDEGAAITGQSINVDGGAVMI